MRGQCHVFTGFFGSGKTEGLIAASRAFAQNGVRVGVITCEAGEHLVDGTALRTHGLTVEQVPASATDAQPRIEAAAASLREGAHADVILIEATGPERRFVSEAIQACSHVTIIDPFQAAHALGITGENSTPRPWTSPFLGEIRQSSIVFINKTDRLSEKQVSTLVERIKSLAPDTNVIAGSFRTGRSVDTLVAAMDTAGQSAKPSLIESRTHPAFSALNARLELSSARYFDGNQVVGNIAIGIAKSMTPADLLHLKISVNATLDEPHLTLLDIVAPVLNSEIRDPLPEPITHGDVIVNVRATANPDKLTNTLTEALNEAVNAEAHLFGRIEAVEAFRL